MKVVKFFSTPFMTLLFFGTILISGKSVGGPYLIYFITALPYGILHAVLAISGIGVLLIDSVIIKKPTVFSNIIKPVAVGLLFLSLYFFFLHDREQYNHESFKTVAFWITFGLFCLSAISLLINHFLNQKKKK